MIKNCISKIKKKYIRLPAILKIYFELFLFFLCLMIYFLLLIILYPEYDTLSGLLGMFHLAISTTIFMKIVKNNRN